MVGSNAVGDDTVHRPRADDVGETKDPVGEAEALRIGGDKPFAAICSPHRSI